MEPAKAGKPKFKNGICILKDYAGRFLELPKYAWDHIIDEHNRRYFERSFDKLAQTLRGPSVVRKSTSSVDCVIYERFFDYIYIVNSVLGRAYISVVVNLKTKRIRTAYVNPRKRKKGAIVWPKAKK